MPAVPTTDRTSPYRLLGLALLAVLILAQLAGLVMLARSQVQKAEMRAIAERSARWEAAHCFGRGQRDAACSLSLPSVGDDGFMTAGYAPSR